MRKREGNRDRRLFRKLVRLFPFDFRADHGGEMEEWFQDRQRELEAVPRGRLSLWTETLVDFFRSAPREHWDTLRHDIALALRSMRKNLVFTTVVTLTLALGIGANTAVFSVINAVLLRPLPYAESDHLVRLYDRNLRWEAPRFSVSVEHFFAWRESAAVEQAAAYREDGFNLLIGDEPFRVGGVRASTGLDSVLRIDAAMGSWFSAEHDQPGAERVVVVSHGFWTNYMGGRPSVVGSSITVDGFGHTIIGVLPADFRFPQRRGVDLIVPYALTTDRGGHFLRVLARLASGVSVPEAGAELSAVVESMQPDQGWEVFVSPLEDEVVGSVTQTLPVLFLAVCFILLIACANVANLLLARGAAREVDISIRSALGASRARILRQLLTESAALATAGAIAGVAVAAGLLRVLTSYGPANLPRAEEIGLDWATLLFALAVAAITAVLFGLFPALKATRVEVAGALRGTRVSAGASSRLFRDSLVVGEIALTLVLMIGAGLIVQSLSNILNFDMGFEADRVLTFPVSPVEATYPTPEARAALYGRLVEEIGSVPGVEAVGVTHRLPLSGSSVHSLVIEGEPTPTTADYTVLYYCSSPGYLESLNIPLLRGRLPSHDETFGRVSVAVVSESLARRFFAGQDPIGKRILATGDRWVEIVGIVGDIRTLDLTAPAAPTIYFPYLSYPVPAVTMTVRTSAPPQQLAPVFRQRAREVEPTQPLGSFQTMEDYLQTTFSLFSFVTLMLSFFALVAVALAAVGAYGVVSFVAGQRTREFGLRIALGAAGSDIPALVLRHGFRLACVGVVLGLGGAYLLTDFLSSMLLGIEATDPTTFAGLSALLIAMTLVVSLVPALRANRADPVKALAAD